MKETLTLKQLKQVTTGLTSQSKVLVDGKEIGKISVEVIDGEYIVNLETK